MLLFHQIGAGKTCAAISVAEKMKHKYNLFPKIKLLFCYYKVILIKAILILFLMQNY
jgi:hypothetical protein